ncbi:MAG TPA: HAD family hydrolase [Saprospiraceae bacterium]|nr:HAD family hydrolase [Saprospiraceae bacterium]
MPKQKAKTLLFDLGNVIIDLDINKAFESLQQLCKRDANQSKIDNVIQKYECGQVSTEIFINTLLSQSYSDVQALDIIEAWNSMLLGIPDKRLRMLRELKQIYNVYLLSNTNWLHLEWVHRYMKTAHGVDDFENEFFHKAYYSHVVGDRKPKPSLFQYVIKDAALYPEETLYMDDVQENINTAINLRFQTYLVKPGEEIGDYLKKEDYY